jgi:hypothetical protein
MKRLMREAYRLNKQALYESLAGRGDQIAWLFVYQGRSCISQEETSRKITKALQRWLKDHG